MTDSLAATSTAAPRVFLTARWTDVLLVNHRVPPELLAPHVPPGTVLDTPDGEPETHLLSIVALRFRDTHVRGRRLPTAQDFAELNLRFYVRQGERRAAVFLREYVPAPLVILGARLFYRQPYYPARIRHEVTRTGDTIHVQTRFRTRGHRGEIAVEARNAPEVPPEHSTAHFLKEHYWGVHADGRGGSFAYRVEHPVWRTYPVTTASVTVDPGVLLGGEWRGHDWEAARHSVVLAEGSAARVFDPVPVEVSAAVPAEGGR